MLLKNNYEMTEVYDSTLHFTQTELMEKFNLAFYEGQNLSKNELLSTFEDTEIKDDYLIDYLMSNDDQQSTDFDFNDFVRTFDQNLYQSTTDTETTISSENDPNFTQFYTSPQPLQNLDLSDIDLCDGLSNESIDLDNLTDLHDLDEEILPSIATISKNNIDFNNFLRNGTENNQRNEFGHLIGVKSLNNNYLREETQEYQLSNNQVVLSQSDALLNYKDDPLLSSSSLMYSRRRQISESETSNCDDEISSSSTLQCQWENCYQIYDCQNSLVKHIEKCHVEVKRGDEFTCYWANCPRKIKPFNARYKLLIHMRVHSGEKPNKCPFEGCNKAFSRLENLKIHQRSHTGERPYLCQFPTCTKSFSNSSDRAKHQRTHFDTKPYACQVQGCTKKYTDPSSLRKHVKNHTNEEQMLIKKKHDDCFNSAYTKKFLDPNRQKAVKSDRNFYANLEHNYSNNGEKKYDSNNIRQDLKNKISEKSKKKLGF